ncbi:hypothetical protein [Streptobacillus canis]|uniref:hypothetical protein n=1 Tax=Streptobacillus canis TaxID=2678686 RepID=UPI0012E11DA2|nr:hypothetical protein [Streptobacillus canis]
MNNSIRIIDLTQEQKKNLKSFLKIIIYDKKIIFNWNDLENRYLKLVGEDNGSFLGIELFDSKALNSSYGNQVKFVENDLHISAKEYIIIKSKDKIEMALYKILEAMEMVLENENDIIETINHFFNN